MNQSEYIDFTTVEIPMRKTAVILVKSKRTRIDLGEIRWYGAWRQYAFFPAAGTIWNPDCLKSVNEKIAELMTARREELGWKPK